MVLTRNMDENYYTEGDSDKFVKDMLDNSYLQSSTINQSFWAEADIDVRFRAGDQSAMEGYQSGVTYRKRQFYFNRIRRVTNLITGFQRRNRKSTIAVPVEHNDDQSASQWSKLLFHTMSGADAPEMLSEAFEHGSVVTGMSLLNVWMDYAKDPESGDLKLDHVPYNSFLIDPYFRKKDLSDCNYLWRRKWMTKEAIQQASPEDMADFIDSLSSRGSSDGKFQYMAEALNQGVNNLLPYDEYWYKCTRKATFLIDPTYGLSREWTGSKEEMKAFLKEYPSITVKKTIVPTVKLVMRAGNQTIYHGDNPFKIDRYPFVPVLGYYDPNIQYFPLRVQGVVRGLRDPQFLFNRRKNIELDVMESQVNSGYKYKPTSLVNPKDIFLTGQGKGLAIKQEADMNDVQEIRPADIPASMIQLSELLSREIQEISGVNEELLGSAEDDKSGILSMLRQGAGLTTLQVLFDQADQSQKLLGQVFQEMIQKNYSYGKIARILGEEPVPEFESKTFLNYDIRIEEGLMTTSQRQLAFTQSLHMRELGLPIPVKYILDLATVQDKEKLMQYVDEEEKAQAEAQQNQMQAQMEMLQAQIEEIKARAISERGLGLERQSRVFENISLSTQREAEAVENIASARLDKVKALKELQEMDINQIQKLLDIVNSIQLGSEEAVVQAVDNSKSIDMPQINTSI